MTTRTLVLVRHAKAEASAPTDFERRLTERGHADAAEAGTWLAEQGIEPDYALVSAAARTTETWEDIALAAGWELDLAAYDDGLFAAGTDTALDLVRETEDGITTLLVIGHNPTIGNLAQLLDDGAGDEDAGNAMALGFSTAGVAVFAYDGDWADLEEGAAMVTGFHLGRG
jgi:phosphohistidine phosphatase